MFPIKSGIYALVAPSEIQIFYVSHRPVKFPTKIAFYVYTIVTVHEM